MTDLTKTIQLLDAALAEMDAADAAALLRKRLAAISPPPAEAPKPDFGISSYVMPSSVETGWPDWVHIWRLYDGATRSYVAEQSAPKPAAVDAERERKIEAWRKKATSMREFGGGDFTVTDEEIDEAVALMRSAPASVATDQELASLAKERDACCDDYQKAAAEAESLRAQLAAAGPDAKLRELRAWAARREDNDGFTAEYRQCAGHLLDEIDRLLAAPPAPRIEKASEPERWREKLMGAAEATADDAYFAVNDTFSRVNLDLLRLRDFVFALREQVDSQARRIEALERGEVRS